ncbi:MAG: phosphoethanolamine--lipid A transferase [Rhizobacter sp.]|nr:phosphoethanolamine--lipid A transferase [Rhizobacter sp.]
MLNAMPSPSVLSAPASAVSDDRGWNPLSLAWLASAWVATLMNWPLWAALDRLPETHSVRGRLFLLALCAMLAALTALLLSLAAWRWSIKPVLALFLLSGAAGAHFMGAYNVVIDSTMMVNVLHTDLHETRDLLSGKLFASALLLGVLPLAWLLPLRVQRLGWKQLRRNLWGATTAGVVLVALLLLFFADMSATMRNHKPVRYLINPLNSFYALGMVVAEAHAKPGGPPVPVGTDARLVVRAGAARPRLLVLVLGETARADHFSLNGYTRSTTPRLGELDVLSFRAVSSCGTSTAASVPCMFSVFGKAGFEAQSRPHENLLDVLQHAGLAVLWVDNQSGCKGVCDRVANAHSAGASCEDGECLDEASLHGLDERIAALPAERREKGVVVVIHQMGSHGPAYWKRSPASHKRFEPECQTIALQDCDRQALVNAYDNSIAYTDQVLASTIAWLRLQADLYDSALLYVSDHGESLGENNLYLHGLPYAFAPQEQKHVPMVMWLSPAAEQALTPGCLKQRLDTPFTHDNLSHTVLGMMGVQTEVYRSALDVTAPCRAA